MSLKVVHHFKGGQRREDQHERRDHPASDLGGTLGPLHHLPGRDNQQQVGVGEAL